MATNALSIGISASYSTGTLSVDATGTIITLAGGSFGNHWGEGDILVINTSSPFDSGFDMGFDSFTQGNVLNRISPTQLTLQTSIALSGQSGLTYSIQRAYSTINAWHASQQGVLTSIEKGVMRNDAVFDEKITINGSTCTSGAYMWLTTPLSDRHKGEVKTGTWNVSFGTTIRPTTYGGYQCPIWIAGQRYTVIDGLRVIKTSAMWGYTGAIFNDRNQNSHTEIKNCIVIAESDVTMADDNTGNLLATNFDSNNGGFAFYVHDNIFVSLAPSGTNNWCGVSLYGGYGSGIERQSFFYNNTVYGNFLTSSLLMNCTINGGSDYLPIVANNYICNTNITGSDCSFLGDMTNARAGFKYNITDDATAGTSNNNGQVVLSACKFVSLTSGAEDLHLKSSSSLQTSGIGPALDSRVSSYSIENLLRSGNTTAVGASLYTLILGSTIGTSGRDYSTITSWEASCPTNLATAEHQWVGYCYNDSQFIENITFAGTTTTSAYGITLTVPVGQRHRGVQGTGVVLNNTGINADAIVVGCHNVTIEYMEIKGWGSASSQKAGILCVGNNSSNFTARYNIIHDAQNANGGPGIYIFDRGVVIHHNIIYDSLANASLSYGIRSYSPQGFADPYIYNNTFYIPIGNALFQQDFPINVGTIKNNIFYGGTINNWLPAVGKISNNATNQSSLNGTNNILNITSGTFVSLIGTFDMRLKSTAPVIGYGVNLGSPYNIDVTNQNLNSSLWDIGAHQLTITSTIGTSARDYSTITSWEASCPSDISVATGLCHVWKGECYADSAFNELITFAGITTDSTHNIILTAPVGQRHNGTAFGGGVVIDRGGAVGTVIYVNNENVEVSWLRITNYAAGPYISVYGIFANIGSAKTQNCIVHDSLNNQDAYSGGIQTYGNVQNCLVYNMVGTAVKPIHGIIVEYNASCYNNTVYNIRNTGIWGTSYAIGISTGSYYNVYFKNNIAMGSGTTDISCVNSSVNFSNNMTGDATAPGANAIKNKIASNQFVSISGNDYHLKSGSDAIRQGVTLGANYSIDIDGFDRLSAGYIWDIGAHQFTQTLIVLNDVYEYYYRLLRNQRKGYLC